MCFSKPSQPDYSAEDRAREEQRQATVRAGSDAVNQAFSRFGPKYYGGIADAFRGYYRPQLEEQAKDARRAVALSTADNPNSSSSNRMAANLERDRTRRIGELDNAAVDAVNQAKQDVEGRRGNLLNVVEAGGSVENAASQAISQASADIGRPNFSPLGDLFGRYTGLLSTAARGANAGVQQQPFWQRQIDFLRGGGSGSSTVVGG